MQGPPKEIFPHVLEFCHQIPNDNDPFYIAVTADENSLVGWCTEIVKNRIKTHGGKAVFGWRIWEWYGVMIEAEFHAVWESPDSTLHDITPAPKGFERTLFLRDDSLVYENKQIDNIRQSLIKDSRVNELINISKEIFNLKNKGSRAFEHGLVEYSDIEADQLRSLELSMLKLQIAIQKSVPGRNEMCRCGSGKSSKKCCFK